MGNPGAEFVQLDSLAPPGAGPGFDYAPALRAACIALSDAGGGIVYIDTPPLSTGFTYSLGSSSPGAAAALMVGFSFPSFNSPNFRTGTRVLYVPRNVALWIAPGAILSVAPGTVIEIEGPLWAGRYQIFTNQSQAVSTGSPMGPASLTRFSGEVIFSGEQQQEIFPEWWGGDLSIPRGISPTTEATIPAIPDMSYALQRAINAAFHHRFKPAWDAGGLWHGIQSLLPPIPVTLRGTYAIARELTVSDRVLTVGGAGFARLGGAFVLRGDAGPRDRLQPPAESQPFVPQLGDSSPTILGRPLWDGTISDGAPTIWSFIGRALLAVDAVGGVDIDGVAFDARFYAPSCLALYPRAPGAGGGADSERVGPSGRCGSQLLVHASTRTACSGRQDNRGIGDDAGNWGQVRSRRFEHRSPAAGGTSRWLRDAIRSRRVRSPLRELHLPTRRARPRPCGPSHHHPRTSPGLRFRRRPHAPTLAPGPPSCHRTPRR